MMFQVLSEINSGHPAMTELAHDAVAVGQGGLKAIRRGVGQLEVLPEIALAYHLALERTRG